MLKSNPCIMSGGIYFLTIVVDQDTTDFELMNTFHRTALRITDIINRYLPKDNKIWANEKDIIDCETCWKNMEKRWKKE